MPLLAQELENGRVLKTNDPAYEWAEAEAKKLLAKQKGQTVFDCFKLAKWCHRQRHDGADQL